MSGGGSCRTGSGPSSSSSHAAVLSGQPNMFTFTRRTNRSTCGRIGGATLTQEILAWC
jgi:hypothetical protein